MKKILCLGLVILLMLVLSGFIFELGETIIVYKDNSYLKIQIGL